MAGKPDLFVFSLALELQAKWFQYFYIPVSSILIFRYVSYCNLIRMVLK